MVSSIQCQVSSDPRALAMIIPVILLLAAAHPDQVVLVLEGGEVSAGRGGDGVDPAAGVARHAGVGRAGVCVGHDGGGGGGLLGHHCDVLRHSETEIIMLRLKTRTISIYC